MKEETCGFWIQGTTVLRNLYSSWKFLLHDSENQRFASNCMAQGTKTGDCLL